MALRMEFATSHSHSFGFLSSGSGGCWGSAGMLGPHWDELPPVSGGDLGAAGGSAGSEGVNLGNFFGCGFTGSNAGAGATTGVAGDTTGVTGRLLGVVASSLLASGGVSGVGAPSLFRGGGGGTQRALRSAGLRCWSLAEGLHYHLD